MTYFRYGYDPWMIGLSMASLIPGVVGLAMGNAQNGPTSNIPFWLLTIYVVLIVVMFLTSCFILNDARKETSLKSPLVWVSLLMMLLYVVAGIALEVLHLSTISFALSLLSTLSIALMAIARKNWIALVICSIFGIIGVRLIY